MGPHGSRRRGMGAAARRRLQRQHAQRAHRLQVSGRLGCQGHGQGYLSQAGAGQNLGSHPANTDGQVNNMLNDNKLRWIPAYLTESAVQRTLSSGHVFTITDWRANRLADALAKSVSYASAISEDSSDFLAAANPATKHACALLGTVTYAANHKEVKAWRANGTPYTKLVRDTCEEQRLHKTATGRAPEAKQQAVTELTTASPDWARDWAAKTASAEQRVPRHAVSLARSAA